MFDLLKKNSMNVKNTVKGSVFVAIFFISCFICSNKTWAINTMKLSEDKDVYSCNQNVEIDLNGHSINTLKIDNSQVTLRNSKKTGKVQNVLLTYSDFTLDGATIQSTDKFKSAITMESGNSNVIIKRGSVSSVNSIIGFEHDGSIFINDNAVKRTCNIRLEGGTLQAKDLVTSNMLTYVDSERVAVSIGNTYNVVKYGHIINLKISGGKINTSKVYYKDYSDLDVTGGEFKSGLTICNKNVMLKNAVIKGDGLYISNETNNNVNVKLVDCTIDDIYIHNVNGVTIDGGNYSDTGVSNIDGTVTINKGNFKKGTGVYAKSVQINGGTFTNSTNNRYGTGLTIEGKKIKINGGTFNGKSKKNHALYISSNKKIKKVSSVLKKGKIFKKGKVEKSKKFISVYGKTKVSKGKEKDILWAVKLYLNEIVPKDGKLIGVSNLEKVIGVKKGKKYGKSLRIKKKGYVILGNKNEFRTADGKHKITKNTVYTTKYGSNFYIDGYKKSNKKKIFK